MSGRPANWSRTQRSTALWAPGTAIASLAEIVNGIESAITRFTGRFFLLFVQALSESKDGQRTVAGRCPRGIAGKGRLMSGRPANWSRTRHRECHHPVHRPLLPALCPGAVRPGAQSAVERCGGRTRRVVVLDHVGQEAREERRKVGTEGGREGTDASLAEIVNGIESAITRFTGRFFLLFVQALSDPEPKVRVLVLGLACRRTAKEPLPGAAREVSRGKDG
jgi:hypothetical protein